MRKKPILFDYKSDYFDFFQLTIVNGKKPPPKKKYVYIYIYTCTYTSTRFEK